jgi:hypothetical protein
MRMNLIDSQQALSFLTQQVSIIEPQVYRIQYPDIQYAQLIPVDSSGNEWAKSITFFSMDKIGAAQWFNHLATNMPKADINKTKFEQGIEMAAIGYGYTLEELGQAAMVPGTNLTTERADAARFAYESFVDQVAFNGDTGKSWEGFLNNTSVTRVDAAATGTSSSRYWADKTGDQMMTDINDALTGIYTGTNTVEMADTVLLPPSMLILLSNTRIANTDTNVLAYLMKYNTYTLMTGNPLTVRGVLGLESAGTSSGAGKGRMVVYKKDPRVLKMHIPMPHRFLPIWQTSPLGFDIPGIFRLGPVEIRRPGGVRYVDQISPAPT